MSKLFTKIKEEIGALLPRSIFFFILLHLVAFIRVLMLKGTGIAPGTPVSATIAALILGKAVLIADSLPFINRYPDKPLVYNVAWKTTIYALVAMFIHYLERLVQFWREAGGFIAGTTPIELIDGKEPTAPDKPDTSKHGTNKQRPVIPSTSPR